MKQLPKLKAGDKVAILSPSFAAPAVWPDVYEQGLARLREIFALEPVEYPTTRKLNADKTERAKDIIAAFSDPDIKGVIATIGGNDQVTYAKDLPVKVFANNPKPFFGFSDNSHIENQLFLAGVPSFYGGSLFTQFAMQGQMDDFTVAYIKHALFETGEFELTASDVYNDVGLDWNIKGQLGTRRTYEPNDGWHWDGTADCVGVLWGGCVESVDEMLRNAVPIPSLEQFEEIVLMLETSEEIPSLDYVRRVYRALGERGVLSRTRGLVVGRPKAWERDNQKSAEEKAKYKTDQRNMTLEIVRQYNKTMPIIQNMDFGHTDPQIPMPYGGQVRVDSSSKKIFATY